MKVHPFSSDGQYIIFVGCETGAKGIMSTVQAEKGMEVVIYFTVKKLEINGLRQLT